MPPIPPPPVATRTSGLAIAGFVVAFFCGLLGLVLSLLGLSECKKSNGRVTGDGLAIAGIVISIVSTLIVVLCWWTVATFVDRVDRLAHHIDGPEARMQLERMAAAAKAYHAEHDRFPVQTSAVTPDVSCCAQPGGRCDSVDWSDEPWRELGFRIYGTTRFRYSYASEAGLFTATAIGDPGCTGEVVTYHLTLDDALVTHIEPR